MLTRYLQGVKSRVRSELVLRRFYLSQERKCATGGKMMMLSVAFIYRFTVNKMIIENINQAKTRTNERHDETSERGRNCEIQQNLNQMIFYVRSMST